MKHIGSLILGLALGGGACGGQTAGDLGNRADGAGQGANHQGDGRPSSDHPDIDEDGSGEDWPDDTDPRDQQDPGAEYRFGYYVLDGDQVTLSWGNTDRACGDSGVVACNEAKADVTLSLQQLLSNQPINLETAQGVMTSSGVNLGGTGPDDCWWGGGSPWGELSLESYTEDEYVINVTGSGLSDDPNVDGRFILVSCD